MFCVKTWGWLCRSSRRGFKISEKMGLLDFNLGVAVSQFPQGLQNLRKTGQLCIEGNSCGSCAHWGCKFWQGDRFDIEPPNLQAVRHRRSAMLECWVSKCVLRYIIGIQSTHFLLCTECGFGQVSMQSSFLIVRTIRNERRFCVNPGWALSQLPQGLRNLKNNMFLL